MDANSRPQTSLRDVLGSIADTSALAVPTVSMFGLVLLVLGWRVEWLINPVIPVGLAGIAVLGFVIAVRQFRKIRHRSMRLKPSTKTATARQAGSPGGILRGLHPFVEGDHLMGRESEIQTIVTRLLAGETVAIVCGASGVGKTSLLRAGLSRAFVAQGYRPVYIPPHGRPLGVAIDEELRLAANSRGQSRPRLIAALSGREKQPVILMLDQVEMYDEQDKGFEELRDLLKASPRLFKIVLAIRGERLAGLGYSQQLFEGTLWPRPNVIRPLTWTEAEAILEEAVSNDNVPLHVTLIRDVLDDLQALRPELRVEHGEACILPADLQLVTTWLKDAKCYTRDQYRSRGSVTGILSTFLRDVIDETADASHTRKLLKASIRPGGLRASPQSVQELADASEAGEQTTLALLDKLEHDRIVQRVTVDKYQLVHDALVPVIERVLGSTDPIVARANETLLRHLAVYANDRSHTLPIRQLFLVRKADHHIASMIDARRMLRRSHLKVLLISSLVLNGLIFVPTFTTLKYGYIDRSAPLAGGGILMTVPTTDVWSQLEFANNSNTIVYNERVGFERDKYMHRLMYLEHLEAVPQVVGMWTTSDDLTCVPDNISFSPDDRLVVIADGCGVRVFDVSNRQLLQEITPPTNEINSIAVARLVDNGPIMLLALTAKNSSNFTYDPIQVDILYWDASGSWRPIAVTTELPLAELARGQVKFTEGGDLRFVVGSVAQGSRPTTFRFTEWEISRETLRLNQEKPTHQIIAEIDPVERGIQTQIGSWPHYGKPYSLLMRYPNTNRVVLRTYRPRRDIEVTEQIVDSFIQVALSRDGHWMVAKESLSWNIYERTLTYWGKPLPNWITSAAEWAFYLR